MKCRSIISMCVAVLTAAACGGDSGTQPVSGPRLANVRVIHASLGAPGLRMRVGDSIVGGAIDFGEATPFQMVEASGTLEARHFIVGSTLFSTTLALTPDSTFTLLVTGQPTAMTLVVAADTARVPAPGTAKIRVIHSAESAPDIDVFLTQPGVASPVQLLPPFTFRTVGQYQQGDPGDYVVSIQRADSTAAVLAQTDTLGLVPGDLRTVVVLDGAGGGLQLAVFSDPTPPAALARTHT